jgi:hypothetical protein
MSSITPKGFNIYTTNQLTFNPFRVRELTSYDALNFIQGYSCSSPLGLGIQQLGFITEPKKNSSWTNAVDRASPHPLHDKTPDFIGL